MYRDDYGSAALEGGVRRGLAALEEGLGWWSTVLEGWWLAVLEGWWLAVLEGWW